MHYTYILSILAGSLSVFISGGSLLESPKHFFIWFILTITALIVGNKLDNTK